MKKLALFILAFLVLSACTGYERTRVKQAVARDTLFSVEETNGGGWGIFLTHDESVMYCTNNSDLGRRARNLINEHHGEVVIEFRSLRRNDAEVSDSLATYTDCQTYFNGEGSFRPVLLLDIEPVPGRN